MNFFKALIISVNIFGISVNSHASEPSRWKTWCAVPEDFNNSKPGGNAYISPNGDAEVWIRTFIPGKQMQEKKFDFSKTEKTQFGLKGENTNAKFSLSLVRPASGFVPFRFLLQIKSSDLISIGINSGQTSVELDCSSSL